MTTAQAAFGGRRSSALREFGSAVSTIMVKELRSRMRGRRAFIILTVYLTLLALLAYAVYIVVAPVAQGSTGTLFGGTGQPNASGLIGQWIFSVLSVFQIILVSMIAPALTAGQISLEREKQTLDLLITTPMRPGAIIIGKLLTALAFVVLMIVAAIPICAIVLMYGGASVEDIVRQQLVLLAVAVGFGAIGLFASALTKRTQAATVLAYGSVLVLTLGSAMVYTFWNEVARANNGGFLEVGEGAPEQLRYLNPMVGMLDVISTVEVTGPTRFTRPLYELFGEDLAFIPGESECEFGRCVGDGLIAPGPLASGESGHWWPRISVTFVALAALLTLVSMRLVVPAGMRGAFRRPRRRPSMPNPLPEEVDR